MDQIISDLKAISSLHRNELPPKIQEVKNLMSAKTSIVPDYVFSQVYNFKNYDLIFAKMRESPEIY